MPVGTTGEMPDPVARRAQARGGDRVEVAKGRVPVIAGAGIEQHRGGDRPGPPCQEGRRRCHAGGDALLQQADAGRHVPALQGDRRCGRSADDHLQHPAALRGRHERRDHGAAGQAQEHRRREGRDREPDAAAAHAARLRRRTSASFRARTTPRCPSTPPAGMAASASPPMSRRGCAPRCRMPGAKGGSARRWRSRTGWCRCTTRCSARPARPGEVSPPACWARPSEHCRLPLAPIMESTRAQGARGDDRVGLLNCREASPRTRQTAARLRAVDGLVGTLMAEPKKRRA